MPRSARRRKQHGPAAAPKVEQAPETPRSRAFWSGTLSFGLVTIPVELYAATRNPRSSLRMLAPDGTPLARRYFDAKRGRQLDTTALERGYELEDGSFVVVTDDELDALAPEQSRDIDLTRFVEANEIPPIYFDRAYFLIPTGGSALAYRLLAATMERVNKAGIATFVMRGKQYAVAIFAKNGILRAETLRYADELRSPEDVGLPDPVEVDEREVAALRRQIAKLARDGLPTEELHDTYWQRLQRLAEDKQKHETDVVTPPETAAAEAGEGAEVVDLLEVLKQSLDTGVTPRAPVRTKRAPTSRAATRAKAARVARGPKSTRPRKAGRSKRAAG